MNANIAQIVNVLTSRAANWLTPIIAAAIGVGAAKVAAAAPWLDLSAIDAAAIAGAIVAIIIGTINGLTNRLMTQGVASIQATTRELQRANPDLSRGQMAVHVDGIPGPVTVKTVTDFLRRLSGK
jgi:hypothetical protein